MGNLTDVSLVSKDNTLSHSFETMEIINFFFCDFDVDPMASSTNNKVTKEKATIILLYLVN